MMQHREVHQILIEEMDVGGRGAEGDPVMLEPPLTEAVASTMSGERLCQPFANLSKHGSHAELGPGLPLHNSQGPSTPLITM